MNIKILFMIGFLLLVGVLGTSLGEEEISSLPNPAAVYCSSLYPKQPRVFGTCHYAGKGMYADPVTKKIYPNSPICAGECGYGCECYPSCGHPTSKGCQSAPDKKITCSCVGSSCSPPCVFPDGSECEEWNFLGGTCGQKFTYCEKKGGKITREKCDSATEFLTSECAMCTLPDGTKCAEWDFFTGKCP